MNQAQAHAVNRVLHHLAGSIVLEASELEDDITLLVEAASAAAGVQGALDVEAILGTLSEVAQRHCDGGR